MSEKSMRMAFCGRRFAMESGVMMGLKSADSEGSFAANSDWRWLACFVRESSFVLMDVGFAF